MAEKDPSTQTNLPVWRVDYTVLLDPTLLEVIRGTELLTSEERESMLRNINEEINKLPTSRDSEAPSLL